MTKIKSHARSATNEDKVLGTKIRAFRVRNNISQADLGAALVPPVSFQQIQKYEKGVNRISSTKLVQLSNALGATVGDLLGSPKAEGQTSAQSAELITMMGDHATYRMVKAFSTLPRDMQYKFVGLIESVSSANPQ
jgi:transcriptional regulator with XRE-family HTH domain